MSISNKFNDLRIQNYTITKKEISDEIMIIQGFSKDLLLNGDTIKIEQNSVVKTKYDNQKLSYKVLDENQPLVAFKFHNDIYNGPENFTQLIRDYGFGECIIMNKPIEMVNKLEYRIYDSQIFVNDDFFQPLEDLHNKSLFDIYESSLFDYCMKYDKQLISYIIRENERRNIEFNFDITSPKEEREKGAVGDLLFYNLSKYLNCLHIDKITEEKRAETVKSIFRHDSIFMKNLTNFWISFIFNKIYEKYEDMKLLVFHFGERLYPIEIEEM